MNSKISIQTTPKAGGALKVSKNDTPGSCGGDGSTTARGQMIKLQLQKDKIMNS